MGEGFPALLFCLWLLLLLKKDFEGLTDVFPARMHFTGLSWFRLSFMGGFASEYFHVELDIM